MRLPLAGRAAGICAATLLAGASAAAAKPARNPRRPVQQAADELARLAARASGRCGAGAVMMVSFPAFRLAPASVADTIIRESRSDRALAGRHEISPVVLFRPKATLVRVLFPPARDGLACGSARAWRRRFGPRCCGLP